jgi:hypothetical protein
MFSLNGHSSLLNKSLSSVCGKKEFEKYLTLSWITERVATPTVNVDKKTNWMSLVYSLFLFY